MAKHDYRIQRGEILRMLYRMYPDAVGDNVLHSTFIWITPGVIRGHVAYLVEDGYATMEKIDHKKYEFSTADYILKITPKGIDLLEGNIEADTGIQNPPL
ncbi:MAG: hypothetical protein AB1560_02060 [Pseudomonadota bacterium]